MAMTTEIETYFARGCGRCARFGTEDCATVHWRETLCAVRDLCLDAGLVETVKWGHPVYMASGCNIVVIGAQRSGVRLSFFNAALLSDPDALLQCAGPNSATRNVVRLQSVQAVADLAPRLRAYLAEAAGYAARGVKAPRHCAPVDLPEALQEVLAADPGLSAAFEDLTPGRQRSYAILVSGAKKPETQIARIAKARARILAGKGASER